MGSLFFGGCFLARLHPHPRIRALPPHALTTAFLLQKGRSRAHDRNRHARRTTGMRNPFRRRPDTSRPHSGRATRANHASRDDRDDPVDLLRSWREEEEREHRLREGFIMSALWVADRLQPLVRLLAVAYVWVRQVRRFVAASLRGHGLQSALQDPIKLDTTWQPVSEIFEAAKWPRGSAAAGAALDEVTRSAVSALERWFGAAPEHELVVLKDGVLYLRGPGYRMEIRKHQHLGMHQGYAWTPEDFTGDWAPNHVQLKAWRVVRLHDPVTGTSTGLWLLRGEPDAEGKAMVRGRAAVAIQQLRWLKVTGSVFGRLGQMDDMDKVDRDDMLQVLRGDPDMDPGEMSRIRFSSRKVLMRAMAENPDQSNAWLQELMDRRPEMDKRADEVEP